MCAGYLAITLAKGAASFTHDYLGGWVGAHVVRDLRLSLYDRLQGLSLRYYHRQRLDDLLTSMWLRVVFTPAIDLVATVGTVLVVWFGVQAVLAGRLSLGGLVVFLGYRGPLDTPIPGLSRLGAVVQRALVGAERVAEVLDASPADQERRTPVALPLVHGGVAFRDVTFGYAPGRPLLRDLNLTLWPDEMLVLAGASGAGKTTVVSLRSGTPTALRSFRMVASSSTARMKSCLSWVGATVRCTRGRSAPGPYDRRSQRRNMRGISGCLHRGFMERRQTDGRG